MNKKDFQQVFQSYFHSKYSFTSFLNTKLIELDNFQLKIFNHHPVSTYIKIPESKKLTPKSKELKDYHTFLNDILFKYMNVNNCVYSYRKNRKIYDALYLHKDSKSYFKTDIKSFFKTINKELISNTLFKNINQYPVNKNIEEYLKHIIELIVYNNSLPVGFVTSPSISNAVLYDFDNKIEEYCKLNNIIYTRYSDDLIFSSNDYKILKLLPNIINQYLDSLYNGIFKLNQDKTQFLDKTNQISLLGLIITPDGYITVSKHIKENMKQLLYYYMNDKTKFDKLLLLRYNNKLSKAYGSLNYINDIDKNFITKLRKKYGNFIVDKFLHGEKPKDG